MVVRMAASATERSAFPTNGNVPIRSSSSTRAFKASSRLGWFGIGVYADADLTASVGNITGYPGDQPEGTQWYDTHQIASVTPSKIYYDIDTMGGQSGSAVYRIVDGKHVGIAVHAYGGATHNSGTRISTPVHANLTEWAK